MDQDPKITVRRCQGCGFLLEPQEQVVCWDCDAPTVSSSRPARGKQTVAPGPTDGTTASIS